ncbi:MAG: 2-hydroxyglutaryl-CoA dehydratase [Dehalococcoidia bacterium]|nr:MAG: 2-hydroxyglutaryl-CoA dehydratase [Dehalococcoidia bacterium]
MDVYLGVDVGSVTTKFALVTEEGDLVAYNYLRTQGKPIAAVQQGLKEIQGEFPSRGEIRGVCTTGSARYLAGVVLGADMVKNEITSQAVGTLHYVPDVRTIIEIGGQDSKLIIVGDGVVVDFAMNTVCAAGTGSFLDQQASRLNMRIEDFGGQALQSKAPVHIEGRCTVFAESDMIHKQQMGHETEDITYGLCLALVRNYLNDVGTGKEMLPPIVFQGGVAFNKAILRAFEESLSTEVLVPLYHEAMGAIGAALLVHEEIMRNGKVTDFAGFEASEESYCTSSFECRVCPDGCEIARILQNGEVIAHWGGRCDLWEGAKSAQAKSV